MRLVLDPAEEAVHGEWLRQTPGAYEWWYFDALSDNGLWALTCIWFLGNPFSPHYRRAARGLPSSPLEQNALFFALYKSGRLHAYHFTQFPPAALLARETMPLCLHFGPNRLALYGSSEWDLQLTDENANGRHLTAALRFESPPLIAGQSEVTPLDSDHSWLPIAPSCAVQGQITLRERHNPGAETISFLGTGYHDHNWGRLPFDAAIRDWYWARAALGGGRSVLLYHVQPHRGAAVSHLLLFESGRLLRHDPQAAVSVSSPVWNSFGTRYFTRLTAETDSFSVVFQLGKRLDSAPFYLRAFCAATIRQGGHTERGQGMGEYLRPRLMSSRIAESAMKARIVQR